MLLLLSQCKHNITTTLVQLLSPHWTAQRHPTLSEEGDSPATVGQSNGDRAEEQIAFRFADDGLTVGSWGNDHKLSYAIPATRDTVTAKHLHQHQFSPLGSLYIPVCISEAWYMHRLQHDYVFLLVQ